MLCTTVALLLFLVAAAAATPVASREIKGRPGTEYDQCFQSLSAEAGALNLGQRWGQSSPATTFFLDLNTVTSATSFFDFRTFDPEGVIFYGDTIPGVDWFVLALREGKPEIHIHNFITNITISSGRPVNDGRWHKIMVKNQGHQVILAVDGEDHLTLSHVSDSIVDQPYDTMRIVVGGLLIPVEELLVPLNPAMDGCMRRYKWLNQTSERLEGISAQDRGAKACFHTISNGSFFPGDGLASFTLTGLPASRPNNWNWSLTVEMRIQAAQQSSTLLAISGAREAPVLRLNLNLMDLVAQVGNKTALSVPLPVGSCRDLHVHLSVTPSHLKLHLGDAEASMDLSKKDFEILTHPWLKGKGHLTIGGLPGPDPSVAAQERSYFRGCLREVRVQGAKLDFDSVKYRSDSIWAHSCPGERGSKANTYNEN